MLKLLKFQRNSWFGPEMLLLSAIVLLVEFVRGAMLISFLPIYGEKQLGLSLDIIGIAITAHYLTDTGLKLMIGYLLDRFSVRFVVHLGLLICLAGVILLGYAGIPILFIAASAIYGIGISPVWIVCLTKVTEEHRATQMGYLYTLWFIGLGAGPVVCNMLLDFNPLFTFYLLVALSLLAWLLALLINNKTLRKVQQIPFKEQVAILKEKLKQMKLLLPGMILQTTGASMLVPILPSFADKQLGITNTQYSFILMAGGLCTVLGLMPMGRLADRLGGKKWFLVIGFSLFAITVYMLTLKPPIWECIVLAAILGLSYATLLPAWNALLASYVPPSQQGLGWGVFSTIEGVGVMIGPVLGGMLASANGETSVVLISAILFGIIGLFYLWFPFRAFEGQQR
ncbi:MFS transporter [Paenibacillus sp. GCM10012307]|uniref:MFS transporter n=1 Tax=Paenibacillus roseus TaxID=2798579 RepID=A0A934J429_9BACL|nr:MFS transporter [Paenibacillus roseus]MBJ6360456.1 MFS transporter [Paenibacillus roseus]